MDSLQHDDASEVESLGRLTATLNGLLGVKVWSAETNLKLERIRWLVDLAGSPQAAYDHVHVGGTSGKGSVASVAASILTAHGFRVGLHLSPYVQTLNETWQIDGRNVRPSIALQSALRLFSIMAMASQPYGPPSYFEFKVALAFLLFKELKVDRAVVEVGLGGMLDATNVLGPGVKVLTNVGLDHVEILGDTVEKIAADKIGIVKPGSVVVAGVTQTSVRKIVKSECDRLGVRLWLLDDALHIDRVAPGQLRVELAGKSEILVRIPDEWQRHQDLNAGLSIAAAIESIGTDLDPRTCAVALAQVRLPGRVEIFEDSLGTVILDGAHNEDKLRASLAFVQAKFPGRRRIGVIALKKGKDVDKIVSLLVSSLSGVVFTTFNAPPWQCVPPKELAELAQGADIKVVETRDNPVVALERARELASEEDIVLVTGSLYLAGNVRNCWIDELEAILHGGSYSRLGINS